MGDSGGCDGDDELSVSLSSVSSDISESSTCGTEWTDYEEDDANTDADADDAVRTFLSSGSSIDEQSGLNPIALDACIELKIVEAIKSELFLWGFEYRRTISFSQSTHMCVCECATNEVARARVPAIDRRVVIKCATKLASMSPRSQKATPLFHSEMGALVALQHPNIVRMFEVFDTRNFHVMVIEMGIGDLLLVINTRLCDERDMRRWSQQLLSALAYMHQEEWVHRDVKSDNVLLFEKHQDGRIVTDVKLCDFGFATRWSEGSKLTQSCGTKFYSPPGLLRGEPYVGPENDAWNAGFVIYTMLHREFPFAVAKLESRIEWDIYTYVFALDETTGDRLLPLNNRAPKNAVPGGLFFRSSDRLSKSSIPHVKSLLLGGLLCIDGERRMRPEEALKNPWFSKRRSLRSPRLPKTWIAPGSEKVEKRKSPRSPRLPPPPSYDPPPPTWAKTRFSVSESQMAIGLQHRVSLLEFNEATKQGALEPIDAEA